MGDSLSVVTVPVDAASLLHRYSRGMLSPADSLTAASAAIAEIQWLPQLVNFALSTVVGTALGFFGSLFIARGASRDEGRRQYRARLDDALAALMGAIPDRVRELDEYSDTFERGNLVHGIHPDELPRQPGPYVLGVRMETTLMIARGDDVRTLKSVQDVLYALVHLPPTAQRARLSQLSESIRKWRHGEFGDQPWAHFAATARQIEERSGMTPVPPWDDSMRNVVTKIPKPSVWTVRWREWRTRITGLRRRRRG